MRAMHAAALTLLTLLAWSASASAEMTESKRLLIRELLELSGGSESDRQVAQLYLAQLRVAFEPMVDEVIASETELGPEEKERLRARLSDFDRFAATFHERFPERIDLAALREQTMAPLYDRSFEEAELEEIVAFYRRPVGRKVIALLPAIQQEGMEAVQPLLQPQVMQLVGEILAEARGEVLP